MEIKKRLLYYIWLPNNHTEFMDEVYDIHFRCLNEFVHIFTDAEFYIAIDSITKNVDAERIKWVKEKIYNLQWNPVTNISINIIENNPMYRESIVFYNEISLKLNDYDGLTFFAHARGLTRGGEEMDRTKRFIVAQYFLGLYDQKDIEESLLSKGASFYLTFLYRFINGNYETWIPVGAFQWLNTKKISEYLNLMNKTVPELANRMYSEDFCHLIFHDVLFENIFQYIGCYDYSFWESHGIVENTDPLINFFATDYMDEFKKFTEKIDIAYD